MQSGCYKTAGRERLTLISLPKTPTQAYCIWAYPGQCQWSFTWCPLSSRSLKREYKKSWRNKGELCWQSTGADLRDEVLETSSFVCMFKDLSIRGSIKFFDCILGHLVQSSLKRRVPGKCLLCDTSAAKTAVFFLLTPLNNLVTHKTHSVQLLITTGRTLEVFCQWWEDKIVCGYAIGEGRRSEQCLLSKGAKLYSSLSSYFCSTYGCTFYRWPWHFPQVLRLIGTVNKAFIMHGLQVYYKVSTGWTDFMILLSHASFRASLPA
jgi:hypothetical protein